MKAIHVVYVLLAVGILVWWLSSRGGGDEARLEAQLERLETLVEKAEGEGALEATDRARRLGELFTRDFRVELEPANVTVSDRQALVRPFVGLRRGVETLAVSFADHELEVDADLRRAVSTLRATVSGRRRGGGATRESFRVDIEWREEDGEWRMEEVRVSERQGGGLF